MTAKADKDTTIAGPRLEAACGAFGLFIALRFLIRCFSHLRSLRVSPVARFFIAAADQQHKEKRAVAWTIRRRFSRDCHPKPAWIIGLYG